MVPVEHLTHILYAFANLRANTGEVILSDEWSDKDIHFPGDSWDEPETHLFGNLKQFALMKRRHRHLKLLLSIGGWTYSAFFDPVVVNPNLRATFVATAVKLVEDYGLDGLDIDYEYPKNDDQAQGYLELIKELRIALDALEHRIGIGRFELSVAAPCGPDNYTKLHLKQMDSFLDFWNLMAYDYAGSWDSVANHQANVLGLTTNTATAVQYYHENGQIPRHKLVIGIPLYGRSFLSCNGPGTPFRGVGQGSWEAGVYDYRSLPLHGATVFHDRDLFAAYSYDPRKGEMITYDDTPTVQAKADWIIRNGLGGAMFWEISGDKDLGPRDGMEDGEGKREVPGPSLIRTVAAFFAQAGPGLHGVPNRLHYPTSRFPNLRQGI